MAQAFVLDCLKGLQMKTALANMWNPEQTVKPMYLAAANCLLPKMSMRWQPQFDGALCIGWKLVWLEDCDDKTTYKGTSPEDLGCDLPEGTAITCSEKVYEPNCFINGKRSWTDTDCDTDLDHATMFATMVKSIQEELDKSVNQILLDFLTANAGVNQYADSIGTASGTMTNVANTDFTPEDMLCEFDMAASDNVFGDEYCIIDSGNLYKAWKMGAFAECCANQEQKNMLDAMGICFDIKTMRQHLGRKSTFLVDPRAVGFKNFSNYDTSAPTLTDTQLNLWTWNEPSARLSYRSFNQNFAALTESIRYDFEYQKVCCGQNKKGVRLYEHRIIGKFAGIVATAPRGCNVDTTGILEYVNIG